MKYLKKAKWVAAIALAVLLPVGVALAQETASSINGTIVDSEGNALADATVVVTHEPTGQKKTLTTNESGRYSARGLRVGGPYTIEVSRNGYAEAEENDIYIKLGEDRAIDAVLVEDAIALDTVKAVGVAAQSQTFNPDNMGSGSSISQELITNLPTVDRDIQDYVRLDSRVNLRDFGRGISVSGVNNRFNNISIDGVSIGDPFGLEAGGSPGLSQPFSLDTIEELNIQLSPYDVTLSNFTGANINAITKSGTNDFSGRVAGYFSNEDLQKDDSSDFTREVYSVSMGGPIIKDKLFFFLAYEKEEQTSLAPFTGVSDASIQAVADVARNVWGFEPGTSDAPSDAVTTEESVVLKLDWNINDYHRASFKYQNNEDSQPSYEEISNSNASLSSHWYTNDFENESFNINFYSDWTTNFSTEFRYSTSEFDKNPTNFAELPEIGVRVDDGTVWIGTEQNRHANSLNTKTDSLYLAGDWFLDEHQLTFGFDYKDEEIFNQYIRRAFGTYFFQSVDDFASGNHSDYRLAIGSDPNNPYPSADWSWSNLGLFVQDNWTVNDRLTLQYGFRYDKPDVDNKPRFNQEFTDTFGLPNNSVVDNGTFQPRFGFNYDMSDDLYMQLRGGVGLFTGGTPKVWLSNSYSQTGGDIISYRSGGADEDGVLFTPDPFNQPILVGNASQEISVLDPDFDIPTVIKSNIALDFELPWYGLVASTELEYIKNRDAIFYQNLNIGEPTAILPDGRPSYYQDPYNLDGDTAGAISGFGDIIYLTNTSKGDTKRATVSLELPQTEHWYAKASYTFTDSSEVSPGSSSTAYSNWSYDPNIDPNDATVFTSTYEIENAFTMVVNYQNMFFGDTITNIGLVWESRDGEPYSLTYGNDVNGDGAFSGNDLLYVPLPDEYVLTDPSLSGEFEDYLQSSGLAQYRGRIAPRNAFKAPRINQFDINVSQELPAWGPVRATLFFNIKNLGNMINKDWGQVYTGFYRGENGWDLDHIETDGTQVIDFSGPHSLSLGRLASQWRAQLGFRLDW